LFRRKKKRNEPKKRKNCGRENGQGRTPETPRKMYFFNN
jgi:hypothetical protein